MQAFLQKGIPFLFVTISLFVSGVAFAEDNQQKQIIANTVISHPKVTQVGRSFDIDFSIKNGSRIEAGVKYGVMLFKDANPALLSDEISFPEPHTLLPNALVPATVHYDAPQGLESGNYTLALLVQNDKGLQLDAYLVNTKLEGAPRGALVDVSTCKTIVGAKPKDLATSKEMLRNLKKDEQISVACSVTNMGDSSVSFVPQLKIYDRSQAGRLLVDQRDAQNVIDLAPNQTKKILVTLPTAVAGWHYAVISVSDQSQPREVGDSNHVSFMYEVVGQEYQVGNISLGDTGVREGEKLDAEIFIQHREGEALSEAPILTMFVRNEVNNSCADPVSQRVSQDGILRLEALLTVDCSNPIISVILKDSAGTILATGESAFSVAQHTVDQLPPPAERGTTYALVLLLVLALGVLFYVLKKRGSVATPLAILVLGSSALFLGNGEVRAQVISIGGGTSVGAGGCGGSGMPPAGWYSGITMSCTSSGGSTGSSSSYTPPAPTIVRPTVDSLSETHTNDSASMSAYLRSAGGGTISSRGFCWTDKSTIDHYADCHNITGTAMGTFSNNLASGTGWIMPGTTYVYQAYASNSAGTGYSTARTFTTGGTKIAPPVVTSPSWSGVVTPTTYYGTPTISTTLGATLASDGGSPVTSYGFMYTPYGANGAMWSTSFVGTPSVDGSGVFKKEITLNSGVSPNPGKEIWYRVYARNIAGTGESPTSSFVIPYQCGVAQHSTVSDTPTSGLCASGVASAVTLDSGAGTYNWSCSQSGSGGAGAVSCSASKIGCTGGCLPPPVCPQGAAWGPCTSTKTCADLGPSGGTIARGEQSQVCGGNSYAQECTLASPISCPPNPPPSSCTINNVCDSGETIFNCPKDCAPKWLHF